MRDERGDHLGDLQEIGVEVLGLDTLFYVALRISLSEDLLHRPLICIEIRQPVVHGFLSEEIDKLVTQSVTRDPKRARTLVQ